MALTEEAKKTFKELFGTDAAIHPEDPELYEILQNEIFGEVFSTGILDIKQRECITIVCLACLQTLPQLKAHTGAALKSGCTPLEIRETLYQCAPYIGYPKTLNAVAAADEVFKAKGYTLPLKNASTVNYEDREQSGAALQVPRYGDEVTTVFAKLPAPFGTFVPHLLTAVGFGEFASRSVLSDAAKELTALIAIASLGASAQLKPHIAGAVKAGNSLEQITAALVQALPYIGFPYALSALLLVTQYDEKKSADAYRCP
jgi:4-carboxymuconolactone decarboxylase